MDRFDDAKIGDLVYCRLRGDGVITSVTYSERYMLECSFEYERYSPYDYSGRSSKEFVEPTLFYRKGEERYLEKRPEPELEVDWTKVPINTKVEVCDHTSFKTSRNGCLLAFIPELSHKFWMRLTENVELGYGYRYCRLAEPCKPEWVKR